MNSKNNTDELSKPWFILSNILPPLVFSCISNIENNFQTKLKKH